MTSLFRLSRLPALFPARPVENRDGGSPTPRSVWGLVWIGLASLAAGCAGSQQANDAECSPGSERCVCYGNRSCDGALECLSNRCVAPGSGTGGAVGSGATSSGDGDGDGDGDASGGSTAGDGDGSGGTSNGGDGDGSGGSLPGDGDGDGDGDPTGAGGIGGFVMANEDGLLGYWPLDGNLEDATGLNPDGTFSNNKKNLDAVDEIPLRFVDGASGGQGIDFRGDGRRQMPYVDTHLRFEEDSAKTYSVFVKTEDYEHELAWLGNGAPDGAGTPEGNRCYFGVQERMVFVGAGSTVFRGSTYPVKDGNWHHYALRITGNSGHFDVFQDGEPVLKGENYNGSTQTAAGQGAHGTPRGFIIGMGGGLSNHPSNAIIDDVAVFDGLVSDADIKAIAQLGSVGAWLDQ